MTSLYRKWRSRSFDDLYGQEHVVRTLRNAVQQRRIAHAYLFTGPRGTGKTSTARILAKAVNCLHPRDGNPCNECEMCRAADEGRAMDVIEIDAASNTSVENVRDLRERVSYAAGEGTYKVYIVDEVHRLSGAAFDAFLKTLEEPPPHVIFVFASTEPHKVPATIMSRCQRFDFRRITRTETVARLRYVADQEAIQVEDGALQILALSARGSLRDALGLLDQVTSYTANPITEVDARAVLGLADPLLLASLSDRLIGGEVGPGLTEFGSFLESGGDARQLTRQLVDYWRALLLQTAGSQPVDAIDPALEQHVTRQGVLLEQAQVVAVLRALTEQEFSSKFNVPPEMTFEVGFVQAALALNQAAKAPRPPSAPVEATSRPQPANTSLKESPLPSSPEPPPVAAPSNVRSDISLPAALSVPESASAPSSVEEAWSTIVANMRMRSPSLQAVLRSGHLMSADHGELTIGFLYDFHRDQFGDVRKRRMLEEVIGEVLGAPYRVKCIRTTKEEIQMLGGSHALDEDDGFVEEAAERLRAFHIRQLDNGSS